jgi:hypothetical protein
MAVIGTLVAKLNMDSRGFTRGSQKAQGGMSKLASSANRLGVAAAATGAAMAAAAVYGMGRMVKESFKTIDVLAKTSDKLGITTEALVGLRSAAGLTGVSAGTMDTALQRMVRRLSEAEKGSGVAVGALDELGISISQISGATPDQQFSIISEAMSKVGKQSDRVRLAFSLFDTEGVALVNTLKMGSEALKENQERLERVGFAINRVDAAKIEAANDAFQRMNEAIVGAANKMAVALAPTVEKFFTSMARGWEDLTFLVENFALVSQISVLNFFKSVIDAAPQLEEIFEGLAIVSAGLWDGASSGFGKFGEYVSGGFQELGNIALAFADGVGAAWDAVANGKIGSALSSFNDAFTKTLAGQKDVAPKVSFEDVIKNPVKEATEAFRKATEETKMGFDQAGGLSQIIDNTLSDLENLAVNRMNMQFEKSDKIDSVIPPDGFKSESSGSKLGAKQRGSVEAFSAIIGARNAIDKMIAANTKEIASNSKQQLEALNDIRDQGGEMTPIANLGGYA